MCILQRRAQLQWSCACNAVDDRPAEVHTSENIYCRADSATTLQGAGAGYKSNDDRSPYLVLPKGLVAVGLVRVIREQIHDAPGRPARQLIKTCCPPPSHLCFQSWRTTGATRPIRTEGEKRMERIKQNGDKDAAGTARSSAHSVRYYSQ